MKPTTRLGPASLAAAATLALCGAGVAAPGAAGHEARRLVEQKLRLVEMMARSPAAQSAAYGRDAETPVLVAELRKLLDAARADLQADRLEAAGQALDDAVRVAAKASAHSARQGSSLSESALRESIRELDEQVATYRASLVELTTDAEFGRQALASLAELDRLAAAGRASVAGGRLGEASRQLAQAYRHAVEEVSRMHAGRTIVMALKFDTPADEYAYELRRNHSNRVLVDMMIAEGRAEGGRRVLVDRFVAENGRLAGEAERQAKAGDYAGAVGTMEKAGHQLTRALQTLGLPVF